MTNMLNKEQEAKALVAIAFRNGPLEDYHASGQPIGDAEIKALMKHAVDRMHAMLELRERDRGGYESMVAYNWATYCRSWDTPEPVPALGRMLELLREAMAAYEAREPRSVPSQFGSAPVGGARPARRSKRKGAAATA